MQHFWCLLAFIRYNTVNNATKYSKKASRLQDPKNRITPPGSPFFRTRFVLRI